MEGLGTKLVVSLILRIKRGVSLGTRLASDQSAVVADQTKLLCNLILRGGAWV